MAGDRDAIPIVEHAAVINYGRGKVRRRTSGEAIASLVSSLLLALLVAAGYWLYRHPDPSFAGGILVFALLWVACIAALILVPFSVVMGMMGLSAIRDEPDRLRGRRLAVAAILLAIAAGSILGYAQYSVWYSMPRHPQPSLQPTNPHAGSGNGRPAQFLPGSKKRT